MDSSSINGIESVISSGLSQPIAKTKSVIVSTFATLLKPPLSIDEIIAKSEYKFNELALDLFHYQAENNSIYNQYLQLIDKRSFKPQHYSEIPFLPIQFFKTHRIVCGEFTPEIIFESSSTTGTGTSKHAVARLADYEKTATHFFEQITALYNAYELAGLLPNYLEKGNSSLVYMVTHLMKVNVQPERFYLYDFDALFQWIETCKATPIVFAVSFALLDFATNYKTQKRFVIFETGGMKGRKKELTKTEFYAMIQEAFPNAEIRSEYGMTELSSQAYSNDQNQFETPPWMKVLPRIDNDPLSSAPYGKRAALNIIDLANIHSCAFIATDDLGIVYPNGSFEVLGRLDHSDIRGCSLLVV